MTRSKMYSVGSPDQPQKWTWMEWAQAGHIFCNLITMIFVVVFVAVTLAEGITLKNATVNYIENTNLTSYIASQLTKIDTILANINATSGDVRSISHASATAVEDGTVKHSVRAVVNATTRFPTVSQTLVGDLIGNATRFLGTLSKVDYHAVTQLLSDAHDPATQRVVRERVDHALRSFDFASLGMSHVFGTIGRAMSGNQRVVDAHSDVKAEL